jgi:hypothetical protein
MSGQKRAKQPHAQYRFYDTFDGRDCIAVVQSLPLHIDGAASPLRQPAAAAGRMLFLVAQQFSLRIPDLLAVPVDYVMI